VRFCRPESDLLLRPSFEKILKQREILKEESQEEELDLN